MRMYRALVFLVLLLISIVPMESNASKISVIRKLVEISPTPSPSPSPVSPPEPVVKETCEMASNKCHYGRNMTACVTYPGTGPEELHLIVVNDGDTPLKVKVIILPANESYEGIDIIPKHEAKKVTILANVEGSSLIVLNTGPGDCIIQMGARPEPNFYSSYLTPTNGVILLSAAIIIGVSWARCKSEKESRHLDGIPYQELEMGQPETLLSSKVETTNGWNQSWDNDWDEDNAVKSPAKNRNRNEKENGNGNGNGKRTLSRQVNGLSPLKSSSNSEGLGNDGDD